MFHMYLRKRRDSELRPSLHDDVLHASHSSVLKQHFVMCSDTVSYFLNSTSVKSARTNIKAGAYKCDWYTKKVADICSS